MLNAAPPHDCVTGWIETYQPPTPSSGRTKTRLLKIVAGSQEEIEIEELLELEKVQMKEKANLYVSAEIEEKKQKHKAREKLIDELMFSDADAKSIVASHAQSVATAVKELPKLPAVDKTSKSKFSSGVQIGLRGNQNFLPVPKQEDIPLYRYTAPVFDYNGPHPPTISSLAKQNYFTNIRSANVAERAGGYTEALSCCRAIQEAFGGLFYVPRLARGEEMETV